MVRFNGQGCCKARLVVKKLVVCFWLGLRLVSEIDYIYGVGGVEV